VVDKNEKKKSNKCTTRKKYRADPERKQNERIQQADHKRRIWQRRECFSIWCVTCAKHFTNRFLGGGPQIAIRQGHIEHIKQMLDERQNPQCPQCKNPAQFIAEERGVYLRCSNSGRAESIKEMVSERSEWDDALEEMAEPLRVQHLGSILPLGERWVAWATAASAAEKVHIDTELESFTMNSDEHLEIMERRSHGRADKRPRSHIPLQPER
jgi:hypothetical protein